MIVASAFSAGVGEARALLKIFTAIGSVEASEERYRTITKSSMTSANTSTALAKIAGYRSGTPTPPTHRPPPVLLADRRQAGAHDDHRIGDLEGHEPQDLRLRPQVDEGEQVREDEQQRDPDDQLRHHERQQHLEVEGRGDPAPPAIDAD